MWFEDCVRSQRSLWPLTACADHLRNDSNREVAIDIALWDMAGRLAQLPLHRLLGGARDRVPAYASTPLLADAEAYVDYCAARLDEGYTAVKFHCWCERSRDVPMVETVHRAIAGKGLALMLDVEQRYTRDQALSAARRLEPLGLTWFEAPLLDSDLEGLPRAPPPDCRADHPGGQHHARISRASSAASRWAPGALPGSTSPSPAGSRPRARSWRWPRLTIRPASCSAGATP